MLGQNQKTLKTVGKERSEKEGLAVNKKKAKDCNNVELSPNLMI